MEQNKINVLLVEDSPVVQLLLAHVLNADPRLHVMGTANNGQAALEFLAHQKPDVVLMDVHMPEMDGFEATRRIMETQPVPIVICSATTQREEIDMTFRALDAGAVAFVEKPVGIGHTGFEQAVKDIIQSVKLMSEVKVVKRWARPNHAEPVASPVTPSALEGVADIRLVAIGASTGGPPVIQKILAGLPKSFSVPILIVQHIAAGFLGGMVEWLTHTTGVPVHMATHGVQPLPGHAYLAPDGYHMGLVLSGRILLSQEQPENGLRPAVSYLFRSAAAVHGAHVAGVLLTGMGRDGAEELKLLRDGGAMTIAQNAETSVVHGMPGEAIGIGAAMHVLPPDGIAALLAALATRKGAVGRGGPGKPR